MAEPHRVTFALDARAANDLEFIEGELDMNTSDSIRKAIAMLALVVRRQNEGCTPAFVRPDGVTQEIVLL